MELIIPMSGIHCCSSEVRCQELQMRVGLHARASTASRVARVPRHGSKALGQGYSPHSALLYPQGYFRVRFLFSAGRNSSAGALCLNESTCAHACHGSRAGTLVGRSQLDFLRFLLAHWLPILCLKHSPH